MYLSILNQLFLSVLLSPVVALIIQAEKLVGKLDQLGATAGDLGLSLFKVAKFEVRIPVENIMRHDVLQHAILLCCTFGAL